MNLPFTLLAEEHILLKVRRHWLILLRDTLSTILLGVLPIVIMMLLGYLGVFTEPEHIRILSILVSLWTLIIWLTLAVLWTHYYLDIWIVTNRRILNIDQVSLFNRRVMTINLDRIQEITVETSNVLETLLQYGTLTIETAGDAADHERVAGIPHPERARALLLEQMEHHKKRAIVENTGT